MTEKKPKSIEEVQRFQEWAREHEHQNPESSDVDLLAIASELNQLRDARGRKVLASEVKDEEQT